MSWITSSAFAGPQVYASWHSRRKSIRLNPPKSQSGIDTSSRESRVKCQAQNQKITCVCLIRHFSEKNYSVFSHWFRFIFWILFHVSKTSIYGRASFINYLTCQSIVILPCGESGFYVGFGFPYTNTKPISLIYSSSCLFWMVIHNIAYSEPPQTQCLCLKVILDNRIYLISSGWVKAHH